MFSLRLAWRYAFSRSNRHRSASLVITGGIAVGMMALLTMLSLMNSLQSELLEQVKSVESFHVQVSFPLNEGNMEDVARIASDLASLAHIDSVYPFVNTQVVIQNPATNRSATARLRIVDSDIWGEDNPFSERAGLVRGSYPGPSGLALSPSMAAKLGASPKDQLRVTVLVAGKAVVLAPMTLTMQVNGLYTTGLHEFDLSTVITDTEPLAASVGLGRIMFGMYLEPGSIDRPASVAEEIGQRFPEARILTWQQANSAFYSALMLEKFLMYLFLFFMFIILGVNMKNASSRLLHVKQRELAVLRALGTRRHHASTVFLGQAAIVTLIGESVGVAAALLLGKHVGTLFTWMNAIQYVFTGRNNLLLTYPFTTLVRPLEVVAIYIGVFLLSMAFTYLGCRRMLMKEPMEMLYHD